MKFFILMFSTVLFAQASFAAKSVITEYPLSKKVVRVDISENSLDEIRLVLSKKIVVSDCNQRSFNVEPVLIRGSGSGYSDHIFVKESLLSTAMGCPREKETIIIKSEPLVFKTYALPDSDDRVLKISLVVDTNTEVSIVE